MPTLNIEGRKVTVDDSFLKLSPEQQNATVDEIAKSIGVGGQSQATDSAMADMSALTQAAGNAQKDTPDYVRASQEAGRLERAMPSSTTQDMISSADPMLGWGDEASSVIGAPIRMMRDNVGYGEAYKREQMLKEELQRRREARSPIASTVGKLVGGGATGGTLAGGGLTIAGKTLPYIGRTIPAMLEGGAYGAVQGAGDATMGNKLEGAAIGGATGAATAGLLSKAGDVLANRGVNKAINAATPDIAAMKAAEDQTFTAARNANTFIKRDATNRLVDNMQLAAGRINPNLRQKTAGMVDDIMALKGKALDVQGIHELRQEVQRAMLSADDQDARTLGNMLKQVDNFIDNAKPSDIVGGKDGLDLLRSAIEQSSRRFKAERIAKLMDLADVKTGNYTQSGMMNALRSEASTLYRQIVDGRARGFTKTETEIIRQLASAKTSSAATKWIAKFAPRGVVSLAAGTGGLAGLGALVGGPVGAGIGAAITPAAGMIAARSADRAAVNTANQLLGSIARGPNYVAPQAVNKLSKLVPLSGITGEELMRRYSGLLAR